MTGKRKSVSAPRKRRTVRAAILRRRLHRRMLAQGLVLAKFLCGFVLLAGAIVGGAAGLSAMDRYAHRLGPAAGPVRYTIQLDSIPFWMPDTLGRHILEFITPQKMDFSDPDLCRVIHEKAEKNPWIARVMEVRRVRLSVCQGVVRVRAVYRQPVAKVSRNGRMYPVDNEGVVLPFSQTPRYAAQDADGVKYYLHRDAVPRHLRAIPIHYIVIEGVEAPPPPVGSPWPGDDLREGLRLVRLIQTRSYANQVAVVDVRNHDRRISESEPELCLYARQGRGKTTEIRFGRFPHPDGGDWVISPARKMRYLDDYVQDQDGRLAGVHRYIDLRFDELRVSLN